MEVVDDWELCFPEFPNISCWKPPSPWPETLLINIALYSISVLTAVLNLLIIISVSHFRQLHTPTNILLLSLAVSDFLVGLLVMPVETILKTSCWFLDDLVGSLYIYVTYTVISASVGDLVLISVDRYVAICDPLHYTTRITVNRVKVCVCLLWVCCVAYIGFLLKQDLSQKNSYNFCNGECVVLMDQTSDYVDLVLNFIVPITVIIVLYSQVFVVAVSQARAMRSHITVTKQSSVTKTAKKSELKAARTLGVFVVVFLMCYCPYYCVSLVGYNFLDYSSASFMTYLIYFNSCLNPVIYALFYPWFRRTVKLIVTLQILQPGSCEANIL
ncbi:trace amine-associated receptor 13c-like [Centropristis striata]|uniref:trace amine-associated receptor 13c-like n=1 Tax=Centropristis striata TaxID=184440 RepID=UPI0027E1B3B7|nr:trace amine-associated receptor 13c-like [Centropristis striata]